MDEPFLNELYRDLLDAQLEHIALIDRAGVIRLTNRAWNEFACDNGNPELDKTGVGVNYFDACRRASDDPDAVMALDGILSVMEGRRTHYVQEYPCHSPATQRWFMVYATYLAKGDGFVLASHINITDRKLVELDRESIIRQLQTSLAEVKVLKGLLPICAICKKIRDDQGYWTQLEQYIDEHSEASFSHGFCPDCFEKHYGHLPAVKASAFGQE